MSTPTKKFDLLNLPDVFGNGNHAFVIPSYQRGFSWEGNQIKDMIKDVQTILDADKDRRHFTGTIVATVRDEKERESNLEELEVVDGQQRLTSLVILLSLLSERLKEHEPKEAARLRNTYLIDREKEGKSRRKFVTGPEQDELFEKMVVQHDLTNLDQSKTTKADQNLKNAYSEFSGWVNDLPGERLKALKDTLEHNIGFLFYTPAHHSEAGMMFEVINNRGKKLSELEKIKNYLIYFAEKNEKPDLKKEVEKAWPDLLSNLNAANFTANEDEERFIRNSWIVFDEDTNKQDSYHVYDQLKRKWPPEEGERFKELEEFVRFLRDTSLTFRKVFSGEGVSKKEKLWLDRIKLQPKNASVLPLIVALYQRVADEEELVALLELIEKLNFRYYVTGISGRADAGQGPLFRFAALFYNWYGKEDEEGEKVDEGWLRRKLRTFVANRSNDKKLLQELTIEKDESDDKYQWEGLKFFLASYEEDLRRQTDRSLDLEGVLRPDREDYQNDLYHKEHIWARGDKPELDEKEELNYHKRRLANFILLRQDKNIQVGDAPPEDKMGQYFDDWRTAADTRMCLQLKDMFEEAENDAYVRSWTNRTTRYWETLYQKFLDKREQELLNFALRRWRVEGTQAPVKEVKVDSATKGKETVYEIVSGGSNEEEASGQ